MGSVPHVLAYADGAPGDLHGLLDDYLFTAHAALDAWESTGEYRYYQLAEALTRTVLERFHDAENGGFFDTENATEPQLGALTTRRKPIQDAPTPAGNPLAALLLLRLAELNDNPDYRRIAESTLSLFAGVAGHLGLNAATYAQALRRLLEPHTQVLVVGPDADALYAAALNPYTMTRSVIRLHTLPAELPPAIPALPQIDGSYAIVCTGRTCQPPVQTAAALTRLVQSARPAAR